MVRIQYFDAVSRDFRKADTGSGEFPLIAFSPSTNEGDHTAPNQKDFINSDLQIYGKSLSNTDFIVFDNGETNKSIAQKLNVPMIG